MGFENQNKISYDGEIPGQYLPHNKSNQGNNPEEPIIDEKKLLT